MSKFLASVNSLAEAEQVLAIGVDILDLKAPAAGALGALPLNVVQSIVQRVAGACPVSATVGDLPMLSEPIAHAVQTMSESGVDYIKLGFFPEGDWQAILDRLAPLTQQGHALIAVFFADQPLDLNWLSACEQAGFKGVMLDTQHKQHGSLTRHLTPAALAHFVTTAQHLGLVCGLAGSLRLLDIPELLPLHADYLGFRGALCQQQQRTAELDPNAITAIKHALHG